MLGIFYSKNREGVAGKILVLIFLLVLFYALSVSVPVEAQSTRSVDELKASIADTQNKRAELEKEIARYQDQINTLAKNADSLANTIKSLDLSRKKIEASILLTENKIKATNLDIQRLGIQINEKSNTISEDKDIIAKTFRDVYKKESMSLVETLLSKDSISVASDEIYSLLKIQEGIAETVDKLEKAKQDLEENKRETEKKKSQLVALRAELRDQVRVLEESKKEKNKLLAETKNQESAYKKLLAEKKAKHDEFERELFQYESELRIAINLKGIPSVGSKVLSWPLDSVTITQYFGNTPFATAYNRYNGQGHNGIDLRASIGTKVKSALGGVVKATGNTDLAKGCYSYGKWVVVQHPNGLSTLYGHLSLITVNTGQALTTGDVIGYSGSTGYSFGPHLHFGVYATEGLRMVKNPKSKYCYSVVIPSADLGAYLNPLSYL
ncbi:hypothetical protein EPO17_00320 [Patescibacteria group bacterium]|nr:MAG: hypothetical protein EPO17_00320 [Patescibacteria group bacterium]